MASTAPAWALADQCAKCKLKFSVLKRSDSRHHCRNCGQSFCGVCASLTLALPHFGFDAPVRVCTNCYEKLTLPPHLRSAAGAAAAPATAAAPPAAAATASAAAPASPTAAASAKK